MSNTPVPPDLIDTLNLFSIQGLYVSASPYGSGHINDTYAVNYVDEDNCPIRYIAQRINDNVFKNISALSENVERVTAHLARESGEGSRQLKLVNTTDGNTCAKDASGKYWRIYNFVEGAHTVDRVTDEAQARETALAFGSFQARLATLPGERLKETIPNFHDTRSRFENLRQAVESDHANRVSEVGPEINFAFARESDADVLLNLLAKGKISERVTHNDTKINNLMLDDVTHRAVAVIDLDTVMPGLPLYDFGEMVRTSASSTDEDDPNPENMRLELPYFRALVEGYLSSEFGSVLNEVERQHLGFAGKLMTYENFLRFLTDYLQGDTYYKIAHPQHNLDRTRTQMSLVRNIEEQAEPMSAIVDEVHSNA